ncbi:MAG: NAD(P)/FAD-dependent oxidoreductase [Hyphomicrobium sp.]|nr:NAD(P)/FAD-dependent oxidoreductase [Hyphomicrobium sp.]
MTQPPQSFDAIVIGAGAAGMMCALTAGQRGKKVLLLEHTDKVGAKILISGGGRCNFTNLEIAPGRFVSGNPHFCTSALSRYTQADFIALVQRHGIAFHEKTLGQLFCDGSARAIVAMLRAECELGKVETRFNTVVTDISHAGHFRLETNAGTVTAPALVLATGGLSIPKMGATGFSYDVAKRFGLRVTETLPGLVPLKIEPLTNVPHAALAGVALEAIVSCGKQKFKEAMLFTHHGLSGPAILQISSYWRAGQAISVDFAPGLDATTFLIDRKRARSRAAPQSILAEMLPTRLAQALAASHLPGSEMANIPDSTLGNFASRLKNWSVGVTDSEGYAKAEVTLGGVDTRDLSSKTLEARALPGLFVIGEAVDVTGWLGGYNFQWAWSSGWAAAQAI